MDNNLWLQALAREMNITRLGVADITFMDDGTRLSYPYGISIAIKLDREIVARIPSGPHYEYYQMYKLVSGRLKDASVSIAERIKDRGFHAFSLAGIRQDENYRTPVPFKTLATRSGFGWIGRSATLVTKEYGNAVRLSGVLTDMPLEAGAPVEASLCGDCDACVRLCPGSAVKGKLWNMETDRDELLDAWKCKATVIERGRVFEITEGSCGMCIAVCPWTRKYTGEEKTD